MPTWDVVREWILSGLVQNFIWTIIAILFVQLVQKGYENWRYGRWHVQVLLKEEVVVDREISPSKLKEIFAEPAEMSVFVKGVASPYGWIKCDLLTTGREIGLFLVRPQKRLLMIDLDRNPEGEPKNENDGKKSSSRKKQKAK